MNDKKTYYGHTYPGDPKPSPRWQLLKDHALQVARRAKMNAAPFGEGERASLAGLLHDLGKYGDLFQRRLEGKESGLDHWSVGACCAKNSFKDASLTLVIQGHHIGLQAGDAQTLNELKLEELTQKHPLGLRLTEPAPDQANVKKLLRRLMEDEVHVPAAAKTAYPRSMTAAEMLDTRMLFSALVDADYLDTEDAMRPEQVCPRTSGETLDAAHALETLERYLKKLGANDDVPAETRALRADLMTACRTAGKASERLWTLTAPTGSGKTLAMLLFALTRAATQPDIRRIVVVLPFLTILDQTVEEYRKLFRQAGLSVNYVLEHHSLAGIRTDDTDEGQDDGEARQPGPEARLLVQNWDAPIIITTNVQLLESLHANKPSACRKLHRLARSIILMDEVQTLPTTLALPTLKTLSRLTSEKYGAVVVMATATQPAFSSLHEQLQKEEPGAGWQPREMAPKELLLFERSKRVLPRWEVEEAIPLSEVAKWIREDPEGQILCILNLRKHAKALAELLKDTEGIRHVSTYLCPAHRRKIMKEIRAALKAGEPVRLIATQCVEAGVDLDFPKVFRALGPLDSIAQAAGRCNRHKKRPSGELRVFLPQPVDNERLYPTDSYRNAAQLTRTMYKEGLIDLDDPDTFTGYFKKLWEDKKDSEKRVENEFKAAICRQDFPKIAELYRLIPNDSVNVVVPYGEGVNLIQEAIDRGINRDWIRRAQLYTISLFRNKDGTLPLHVESVNFRPRGGEPPRPAPDWYVCPDARAYDQNLYGFLPDGGEVNPMIDH